MLGTWRWQRQPRAQAATADDADAFMGGGDQGFNDIDLWLGGLAEQKVTGGMLGSTFDFIFATQFLALQNADRFYYLSRLGGTTSWTRSKARPSPI